MKVVFEIVDMETDKVIRKIITTEARADKVEMGLIRKVDGERYFIRDKRRNDE